MKGQFSLSCLLLGCLSLAAALALGCSGDATPSVGPTDTQTVRLSAESPNSNQQSSTEVESIPLATRSTGGETLFTVLDEGDTGVGFQSPLDLEHPLKRLYISGFATGGVCIGDVNGDDLPDLFFASGPRSNRLYLQTQRLEFREATSESGLGDDSGSEDTWSAGAAFADADNDGDLDLFVCNYQTPCRLYLNDGTGRFSDHSREANVDLRDACLMPSFCDFDGDGDLDLFVLTNRYYRKGGRPKRPPIRMVAGKPVVRPEYRKYYGLTPRGDGGFHIDTVGRGNYLLRNEGDGTFTNITEQAGLTHHGHGLSATWWDFNNDHLQDLYVSNDFDDPDQLYKNNGDGTFTNVLEQVVPHTSWFSMGSDSADLNGDGYSDLLVADMSARTHFDQKTTMGAMNAAKLAKVSGPPPQIMKNALLLGSGADRMFEAAELAGLADTDWTWAVKLGDYNNDSKVDALFTNGISRNFNNSDIPFDKTMLIGRTEWSLYEKTPPRREYNVAMRNQGDLDFDNASEDWGFQHYGMSYGAASGDLDRDGDLDLVVVNLDEPVHIYRNDSRQGNRVLLSLKGEASNHNGLGAKCTVETSDGVTQTKTLSPYTGFLSSNEPSIHFGLGDAEKITRIVIDWPSDRRQVIEDLAVNHRHIISEPSDNWANPSQDPNQTRPLFTPVKSIPPVKHREKEFDDFASQPLLPNKLSQLGPGLAVADCNGDGQDDIYMGGAKGQIGLLLVANKSGGFDRQRVPAFNSDRQCEDMGALWIDVDADGDLDLYVVSGGVESEPDADALADRLYLNDGDGQFTKADDELLPQLRDSGSTVCAADFDRDGDVDLFVGSRVTPGSYPESTASRLLRNDDGKFTEVTQELAPGLLEAGMVTSGVWSDANGDGWVDLLVSTEWGPIKIFTNDNGALVESTEDARLSEITGWFNGITARDLDGDNDIDYVVTNFGLNTKYHATKEKPVLLYYGDFEGTGEKQIVEAEFEEDTLFPIRGKSCSSNAMPTLAEKFDTYSAFASASLVEIYTPTCINESARYECNTLESGVLFNDGTGKFEFIALPRFAQLSPSFGVLATEIDGDGYPDLYLAQNFFTPQPETGRMDSGMGLLLRGHPEAEFEVAMPNQSGLVVEGDATAACLAYASQDAETTLVIGQNDDAPKVFRAASFQLNDPADEALPELLKIALQYSQGNATAYGAKVTVHAEDGFTQTAEVLAGSGYLSQTSSTLAFAMPRTSKLQKITVRWPDGSESSHQPTDDELKNQPIQRLTRPE